jgi:hypothetical protein
MLVIIALRTEEMSQSYIRSHWYKVEAVLINFLRFRIFQILTRPHSMYFCLYVKRYRPCILWWSCGECPVTCMNAAVFFIHFSRPKHSGSYYITVAIYTNLRRVISLSPFPHSTSCVHIFLPESIPTNLHRRPDLYFLLIRRSFILVLFQQSVYSPVFISRSVNS